MKIATRALRRPGRAGSHTGVVLIMKYNPEMSNCHLSVIHKYLSNLDAIYKPNGFNNLILCSHNMPTYIGGRHLN